MSPAVIAFKSLLPEGRSTESSEEELSETATSAMVVFPWLPGNELVGPPILQNMQMRGKGQRGKFLPLCHLALVRLHVGRSAQKQQSFRELELFPLKNMCRSVVKKCIWHVRKIEFSILLQKLAIWTSGRGKALWHSVVDLSARKNSVQILHLIGGAVEWMREHRNTERYKRRSRLRYGIIAF